MASLPKMPQQNLHCVLSYTTVTQSIIIQVKVIYWFFRLRCSPTIQVKHRISRKMSVVLCGFRIRPLHPSTCAKGVAEGRFRPLSVSADLARVTSFYFIVSLFHVNVRLFHFNPLFLYIIRKISVLSRRTLYSAIINLIDSSVGGLLITGTQKSWWAPPQI